MEKKGESMEEGMLRVAKEMEAGLKAEWAKYEPPIREVTVAGEKIKLGDELLRLNESGKPIGMVRVTGFYQKYDGIYVTFENFFYSRWPGGYGRLSNQEVIEGA